MITYLENKSNAVKAVCLFISLSFFITCPIAAIYTGEFESILYDLFHIFTMPCPLVTDYFLVGSLPSAFLNAGLCGTFFTLIMYFSRLEADSSTLAGYILVIAHCFYGLNLLNMLPPVIGIIIYCAVRKQSFKDNFTIAMFSTAFGPFVSEFLFRYTLGESFSHDEVHVTILGVILALAACVALGFIIPALLPAARRLHKGYNLYNAGVAFGFIGFFLNALMYNIAGVDKPDGITHVNEAYSAYSNSYTAFISIYLVLAFSLLIIAGLWLNGWKFGSYKQLLKESGHETDLLKNHSSGTVMINIGIYGIMIFIYMLTVTELTDGAGYTGATLGVTFAAITFAAVGQHPGNVWPILAGYGILFALVGGIHCLTGSDLPWTLSTQCFINGVAFATGLCPISGKFGKKAGILAGITAAIISSSTSALHGGYVLYNGGFTAGLAAIVLVPIIEFYSRKISEGR